MAIDLPQFGFLGSSANMSEIFNQFYVIGKLALSFGLLAFVLWWALNKMHILKPKIRVLIKEANGVRFDQGIKIKVRGGITKLKLIREKINISYPNPEFLQPLKTLFGMTYLYTLRKVGEGQFNPMKYGNPSDTVEVMDENTKVWLINELTEANLAYMKTQTWFEKYQTLIGLGILGGLFIFMIIFSLGYMEQVIAAFNNLVNHMSIAQTIS